MSPGCAPEPAETSEFDFGPLRTVHPTLTHEQPPRFPDRAAQEGLTEATVFLEVRIDLAGRPRDLRVLRCTQPGYGFEAAALDAVEEWRYLPAKVGDETVEVYYTAVVRFEHGSD